MASDPLQQLRDLADLPHLIEVPEEPAEPQAADSDGGRGLSATTTLAAVGLVGALLGAIWFALSGDDGYAPEAPCRILTLDPTTTAACGRCECEQLVIE